MSVFEKYIDDLTFIEGGYQNRADDPGNYNSEKELVGTNHGISAPVYERWIGRVPTEANMRAITKPIALQIIKAWYWDKVQASFINSQAVAENIADHAINAGTGSAAGIVQEVLNYEFNKDLSVDGVIGPMTIDAINSVDQTKLFQKFSQYRIDYYRSINNRSWLRIWENRVKYLARKFNIDIKKKV
ncbi:PG_binding_3 domain-containing protein [Tenacibaculum sp. 190130A14a]|uniref:PG_binding_3 domain-containing protein n=1 Tax=Tenacibaculum polynesiense TaxID=3137857 RepID=A0ABM9PFT9_9FLAO